jgi:hypothetical protein
MRNVVTATLATLALALCVIVSLTVTSVGSGATTTTVPKFISQPNPQYPVGTADSAEPSGYSPPSTSALPGYSQTYVNDFVGSTLPAGWDIFTGIPGGDPGGHFGASHVRVGGGMLQLLTYKDAQWNDNWVTGGLCQCGLVRTYGAYFVRSRVSGPGPNEAELLWPQQSVWPPEIDFAETGGLTTELSASLHYGVTNHIDQRFLGINMTKWHTWGIIWTPTSVTYTVDGQIWGSVSVQSEIPTIPMTLDLEQRTKCASGEDCPTHSISLQVDWVAEYVANSVTANVVSSRLTSRH